MAETERQNAVNDLLDKKAEENLKKQIGYNTLGKDYDTLVKKIQSHQKNVNSGAYVSPEAFSTLEKEIADMKKRMSAYGNWIISNAPNSKEGSSAFGAVDNLTQMSNALKGQSSLYADYDENSWKEYYTTRNENAKKYSDTINYDEKSGQANVDALKNAWDEANKEYLAIEEAYYKMSYATTAAEQQKWEKIYSNLNKREKELLKKVNDAADAYNDAKAKHDATVTLKNYYLTENKYNNLDQNADWAEKSAGVDTSLWDFGKGALAADAINNTGKDNLLDVYDAILNNRGAIAGVTSITAPIVSAVLPFLSTQGRDARDRYEHLTDEQRKKFNYLYNTEGEKTAMQYLDNIDIVIAGKEAQEEKAKSDKFVNALAEWVPGNWAEEVVEVPVYAVQGFKSGAEESLPNLYAGLFNKEKPIANSEYLLQALSEDSNPVSKALLETGQSIGNMTPSIIIGTALQAVGVPTGLASAIGAAEMGFQARGSAYSDAIRAGYDKEKASLYATANGALEATLQYALGGIGGVSSKAVSKGITAALPGLVNGIAKIQTGWLRVLASGAFSVVKNMGSEALEEGLQAFLDPYVRQIHLEDGDLSKVNVNWEEIGYSALLGALTSGIMGPMEIISDIQLPEVTAEYISNQYDTSKGEDRFSVILENLSAETSALLKQATDAVSQGKPKEAQKLVNYAKNLTTYTQRYIEREGGNGAVLKGTSGQYDAINARIKDGTFNSEAAATVLRENTSVWQTIAEKTDNVAHTLLNKSLSNKTIEDTVLKDKSLYGTFKDLTGVDLNQYKTLSEKRNAVKLAAESYKTFSESEAAKTAQAYLDANTTEKNGATRTENRIKAMSVLNDEVSKLKAESTNLRNAKPGGYKQEVQKLDSLIRMIINTVTNIRNHNNMALASRDGSVVINNTSKTAKEKSATSENTESVNVSSVTPTKYDLQTAWENLPDEMKERYKLVNKMGEAVNGKRKILTEQDVDELNREAIGREIAKKKERITNLSKEINKTKSASEREALIKERGEARQELKVLEAQRDALEEYLGIQSLSIKEEAESVRGEAETVLQERITALNKYLGKYGVDIAYEMGGSWYVDTDGKLYSDSEATEALKKGKKLFKRTNNGEATDWTIKIMSALAEGTVPVFTNGNLQYQKVGTQIDVDKAVDIIIGHELVHFVKNNASKQSQDLYKKVINNIKGTSYDVYEIGNRMAGLDVSEEADRKWNNLKNLYADAIVNNSDGKVSKAKAMAMVDEDYIYEEIAANYMGSLMASEGVIDTITETLPTMQKIMMSFSVKKKKDGLKREAARVDKLANALLEASNRVHGREQDLTLKRAEMRHGKANETVERMTQKVQEAEEKLKTAEDELKKNNTAYYRDRVEKAKDNLLEAQENEALAKKEAQKAKTQEENAKRLLSAETKTTGAKTKTDDTKHSFSSIAYNFFEDPDMSTEEFVAKDYKETKGYKEYVEKCLNNYRQTRPNFNEKKARKSIEDSIDGIVRVAIAAKNAGYDIYDDPRRKDARDSKNRPLFSSLEPNSDYFTSNDISTECDKRKNFQEIYEAIVKKETEMNVPKGKRFFDNVDNYFYIHKVLAEKGLTQPCRECYVESMRKNLAPMANAFIELVGEEDGNNTSNKQLYNKGELKVNNAELREDVREVLANYGVGADFLTVEMLSTEDGLATLKLTKPEIYEAFNSFYGQSKPKLPRSATPFRFGDLTALLIDNKGNIKQSLVNKINATGGFRLQSYSDFQIENYVDVLQVLFEAGTLGLAGHAYTKVPAFLEATEGTNLKRNISIFMYKDGSEWKIDKNDSFPDSLEDIYDIVDADKSGNTGIIAVSQNDDMSAWIMANDHIGYGIPFHKSGLKMDTVRGTDVKTEDGRIVKGYKGTKDHTKQQTEVWAKTTEDHKALTKVKKGISIYQLDQWGARKWDFDNSRNLPQKKLIEKNVKAYIDACENAGYIPRFRDYVKNNQDVLKAVLKYSKEFGVVSEDATIEDISFKYKGYTIPYGYYKFLGDFEMFTPDGKAAPQEILSLDNYDFDKAVDFFKDAETLKRNEILQQFANGKERKEMRESNLTAEQLQRIVKQKRSEIADEIVTKGKRKSDSKMSVTEATDSVSAEETSVAELVSHMHNIIKERKAKDPGFSWRVEDVYSYVESHPDLNFVDRIYNKDETAKKDLEAFLGKITNAKTLEDFKWFVSQAYNQKDADYWSETYPYRGASRTFQNAVKKRINEIMSEKVGGTDLGVTNGEVSLDTIEDMFDRLNTNEEIVDLAKRAFATADKLGVNIRFANQMLSSLTTASGDAWGDMVEYKTSFFNDKAVTDQFKANTILHEIIHACTNYYLFEKPNDAISRQLKDIYAAIQNDPDFAGQYGLTNVHEMIAELSNEKFVARLKKKNLWNSIIDAIARIFGYSRGTTAYDNVSQILDYLLDNPDVDTYKKHAVKVRTQASASNKMAFGRTHYTDHNGNQRVMYSVTPEEDTEYLEAVERGDMKTAQKMVDEAADKAMPNSILREGNAVDKGEEAEGTLIKMYHGSGAKNFYTFEMHDGVLGKGVYLTSNWDEAVYYAMEKLNIEESDDGHSYKWNGEEFDGIGAIGEVLESEGYVRTFYANVTNSSDIATSSVYHEDIIALVRDKNQLKSADPVTYDDNGNVIPLSERFNPENDDIRYSVSEADVTDSRGKRLTTEQVEFFKDSKIRDRRGDLLRVYHATNADFTVFDKARIGGKNGALFGRGFYFSKDESQAMRYGRNVGEFYLNIKKPFDYLNFKKKDVVRILEESGYDYNKRLVNYFDYSDTEDVDLISDLLEDALTDVDVYATFSDMVQKAGYDGIVAGREIIAFEPEQIKRTDNKNPTSDPDVRYSVTEEVVGGENYAALAESLEKNKANTEKLINAMIKNGRGKYDVKTVPQFIRDVRKAYGSKDSNGVSNAYSDAYNYVYNKKLRTVKDGKSVWEKVDKVDPETAREMFRNVAKEIFDSSVEDDRASLLREIRKIKISVPNEVKMTFENWNKFRTSNFGRLSLVKDGVTIGEAYAKLNEIAPELFPDSITDPVEQLNTISNEATNLRNEIESEEYTTAEMDTIEAITAELIGGTMALDPSAKHLYETLAETRQYYRERIENIKASKDAWWQDMMGEKLRNKDERYRLHYEKGINQKLVKDLTTRLYKPTTDKHIPESMRGDIAYILGGLKLPDKPKAYKELKTIIKNVVANGEFDEATFDKFPEGFEKTVDEVHQVDFENMDSVTAHELNQFLRSVMHYINLEDSLFHSSESASYAAAMATEQINLSTKNNKIVNGFVQKADDLWMSAYDAEGLFNYVGVDELYRAYQEIAKGQDAFASSVSKYTDLMSKVLKENGLNEGVPKEWHTKKIAFSLDGSKKPLLLTQAELMSLYLLEKQEDSRNRLLNIGGGIETLKQGDKEVEETVNGKTKKVTRKGYVVAGSFKLTEHDLYNKIIPKLDPKAKKVADGISTILNGEIANDLNQTSLVVDGYKKFNVKNYFPESVSDTVKKVGLLDKEIEALMTGKSFTKDRTGSKGVPLKINDIFEVYDRHILGASQYIGYEKALRDFNKIYNGTYNGKRLSNAIQNKLGVKTTNAIENFIRSVQGRQMNTRDDQQLPLEKMFGNYKAAKVMLNTSVVMKQPTALLRAVPEFSGKGVDVIARVGKESLKAMGDAVTLRHGWDKRQAIIDEMVEHSGLARMKSWGFSEYATAKTVGQLYDRNSLKWRDKWNDKPFFNLAERADLYTWSIIWEACKAETNTLEEATDKFNDVIRKTQVVESATTSSPIVKSNFYTKIVFAFKNEPLKTLNYVRACLKDVVRGKEGAGNHLAKALVWTGLSIALTSAITTAFSLGRDDEDDDILGNKDWWKVIGNEYNENFWWDVFGTATVFLGDIIPAVESALRGREVERADTALVTDTVNLLMRLYKGNYAAPIFGKDSAKKTGLSLFYDASDVVSTITGLPIRTVMRDTKAIAKNTLALFDDPNADYFYDKQFYTVKGNKARYKDILTEALDRSYEDYTYIKNDLVKHGYTQTDIDNAVKDSDRFVTAWNDSPEAFRKELNEAQKIDKMFSSDYVIKMMGKRRSDIVGDLFELMMKGEKMTAAEKKTAAENREEILNFRDPKSKRLTTEKTLNELLEDKAMSKMRSDVNNIVLTSDLDIDKKLEEIFKRYEKFGVKLSDVKKVAREKDKL